MRRALIATVMFAAILAGGWTVLNRAAAPASVTLTGAEAAPVPGTPETALITLVIGTGDSPDRLIAASSPEATEVAFGGRLIRDGYAIPAGAAASLSADGVFLIARGIEGPLEEGRLIPVSLDFEGAGTASTRARIGAPADPHAAHGTAGAAPADLTGGSAAPEITLSVEPARDGGWTVTVETPNFTFEPPAETPMHTPGQGHAHLYLDGVKLQRLYSPTAEIGALPPGRSRIAVTLNTNTHEPYLNGETPVEASAAIEVR